MQQHDADREKAQCMIKVILHAGLIYGKHVGGKPLLQAVRAKRAKSDAKKCIRSAEGEKDS